MSESSGDREGGSEPGEVPLVDEAEDETLDELSDFLLSDFINHVDRSVVEGEIAAFAVDENAVRPWKIWRRCREASLPIPTEVLAYLDRVAEALTALSATPPRRVGPALQKALEFQVGPGQGSDFSRYHLAERDFDLACDANNALESTDDDGKKPSQEEVFGRIAGAHEDVKEEMVRRAWRAYFRPGRARKGGGEAPLPVDSRPALYIADVHGTRRESLHKEVHRNALAESLNVTSHPGDRDHPSG